MWDLMATHGVDVVISAHNHVSEIFKPIGASGSVRCRRSPRRDPVLYGRRRGGGPPGTRRPTPIRFWPRWWRGNRGVFGPLKLTLNEKSYSWQFLPLTGMTFTNFGTTGSFSGSDSCH